MNKLKFLLIGIIFIFQFTDSIAQDKITTKEGTNLKVKIIYIDTESIYFYQTLDLDKTIRTVNKKYITGYEYNSIENGKNKAVISSDSALFAKYLKDTKGLSESIVISYGNINTYNNDSIVNAQAIATELPMVLPLVNQRFQKAGNRLTTASIFFITGVILNYYVANRDYTKMSASEFSKALDLNKTLTNASYACYGISGLFVLSAGINIHNGAILLK